MGGSPPIQQVQAPKYDDPAIAEAIKKERELAMRRKGRSSTILTGSLGLANDAEKKTLLG